MNDIENSVIFVTGGAGFVGSHLVEELLPYKPAKIIIVDNLFRGSIDNMNRFLNDPRVQFIEGDIRDTRLMERCIPGTDYIFHLAALRINACAANPAEGFEVMADASFKIIEAARKHGVKKLVYSSSASVYGLAQHFPTPESDNPYDNRTFYGAAKLFGEQILRSYAFMYGLKYVALRYFNVYGPRMDTDGKYTEVMIKWLDCIRENRNPLIFGDGSTSMDFVYVKDVAKANVAALVSQVFDETFNIGYGRETSLKQLLEILLKVNNSSLRPEFRDESTVNPVSRRIADITKARSTLGFSPETALEPGLKLLSDWYFERRNGARAA
ncbi:MAG TPA: NAD-dependent epimerase/dehydratase family protein [Syntrophorhabdaceae bacterium]|nr:NAD-dependent epimerase/dehydratase family protein [Syntrophorhabdaceae bacterium]